MDTQTTKISQNRQKKETIVAEITEKVDKSKAMVFTNYAGLTHQQLETFKREIRPADAEFAVAKNTLLKRALGDQIAGQEDKFQQSTGTLFMYGDVVAPLKALAKMMKDFEKPEVKFGLLDGKVITDKDVAKLATLPSREVLIAQMLGMMNAPIQGLHRALSWNLQKFVMTLDAVAKKKELTPTAKPAEETKSETAPVAETPADASVIASETKQSPEIKADEIAASQAPRDDESKPEPTEPATPAEEAEVLAEQPGEEPTAAESTEEKAIEESNA